jgi:mRNA-degrading endonuclease RelE of RelBE toxin-antitoxin system
LFNSARALNRRGLDLTDWNKTYKSDVRGYFLCCPLCGSNELALHLITIKPHIRSIVVSKRFLENLKEEEKAKKRLREVLNCPDADFYELHKFEEHVNSCRVFRAKTGEMHIVYCVDKNKRIIFMRVFKNFKRYKKFIEVDGSRDTLSCYGCGAKWHLFIGLTGLKWAELDLESEDAKGVELLGKKLNKNDWLKMAQNVQDTTRTQTKKQTKGEIAQQNEANRERRLNFNPTNAFNC